MKLENIPKELQAHNQWTVWGVGGSSSKRPIDAKTLKNASATDPGTWAAFADAVACVVVDEKASGVGYALNGSGVTVVDLDHCIDAQSGEIIPAAAGIVEQLDSYTEISPSGTGLHIFIFSSVDLKYHKANMAGWQLEAYDRAHVFRMTGDIYNGHAAIQERSESFQAIYNTYLHKKPETLPAAAVQPVATGKSDEDYLQTGLAKDARLKALWDGARDTGDESADDMALMNKLAYWCNCNESLMIDAFKRSGHFSGKDQAHIEKCNRRDYLARTARAAVSKVSSIARVDDELRQKERTSKPRKSAGKRSLATGEEEDIEQLWGKVLSLEAAKAALCIMGVTARMNEATGKIEVDGLPGEYSRGSFSAVLPVLLIDCLKSANIRCGKEMAEDYISLIADINRYNPIRDMLQSVEWDGADRISAVCEMLGAREGKYCTYVRKWLMQCVAMAFNDDINPVGGDGVLCLYGSQGIGKTTFFRVLAVEPDWFKEGITIDVRDKDTIIKATSAWICELGELDETTKREQPALKAHITTAWDEVRPPYGRTSIRRPRRTSYCATVNDNEFLRDSTGNRRFWIIPTERIDLPRLLNLSREWLRQLWAQVFSLYRDDPQGFRLTVEERDVLNIDSSEFMQQLAYEQEIRDGFDFSQDEVYWTWRTATAIGKDLAPRANSRQVGKVLKKLADEKSGVRRKKNDSVRLWLVPPIRMEVNNRKVVTVSSSARKEEPERRKNRGECFGQKTIQQQMSRKD